VSGKREMVINAAIRGCYTKDEGNRALAKVEFVTTSYISTTE